MTSILHQIYDKEEVFEAEKSDDGLEATPAPEPGQVDPFTGQQLSDELKGEDPDDEDSKESDMTADEESKEHPETSREEREKENTQKFGKPLDEFPEGEIKDIEAKIREGAKDLEQQWTSAIHLVNRAFKAAEVIVPTPADRKRWKQYGDLLLVAVKELCKHRGVDGTWRYTDPVKEGYTVTEVTLSKGTKKMSTRVVEHGSTTTRTMAKMLQEQFKPRFELVKPIKEGDRYYIILDNVKTNYNISIEEL